MTTRIRPKTPLALVLAAVLLTLPVERAFALREGGVGNAPIRDPGWPKGADVIFNTPARIAFWHGPLPGHWHADCRGDAKVFNDILANFAKLDVKSKQIVVHNGIGNSEWLNISNDPLKREAAKIDWMFQTWTKDDGKSRRTRRLGQGDPEASQEPPSQIDVYTGGNIKWEDVRVPQGLKVVDMRLEAHGFTLADGVVLEGKVVDLETKKFLGAMMRFERVDQLPSGERTYTNVAGAVAGAGGHWVLKKAPAGYHRIVIEAPGYVPRIVGGDTFDQPRWKSYDTELVKGGLVAGRVTDQAGKPLADVDVRLYVTLEGGGLYDYPLPELIKTDKDGRFRAEQIPLGKATMSVAKKGYTRSGPELSFTTPKSDVELSMFQAGRIEVTVDFKGKVRPREYLVQLEPEGGLKIGSWGGLGTLNDQNQYTFETVPAGRYVVEGRPNPTTEQKRTAPMTIEVKPGQTAKVTLKAK